MLRWLKIRCAKPYPTGSIFNARLQFATMPDKTAVMIRADLRRARARWIRAASDPTERRNRRESGFLAVVDDAGRVVDFHALRMTYVTLLVKGGASVKVVQELARHSDPKLTMNVYSQLGICDLAGALDHLPSTSTKPPQREQQPMRATGTYDATASNDPRHLPRQLGRETVQNGARACDERSTSNTSRHERIPLQNKGERDTMRRRARRCDNHPQRDSNPCLQDENLIS